MHSSLFLQVEEEQGCTCGCPVHQCAPGQTFLPHSCRSFQITDAFLSCRCGCGDEAARASCTSSGRSWSPTSCTCACPAPTRCSTGYIYDYSHSCSCIKVPFKHSENP